MFSATTVHHLFHYNVERKSFRFTQKKDLRHFSCKFCQHKNPHSVTKFLRIFLQQLGYAVHFFKLIFRIFSGFLQLPCIVSFIILKHCPNTYHPDVESFPFHTEERLGHFSFIANTKTTIWFLNFPKTFYYSWDMLYIFKR